MRPEQGGADILSGLTDYLFNDSSPPSQSFVPGHDPAQRRRVMLLLMASWACAAVLVAGIGGLAATVAGLLLSLALPGSLAAEAIIGRGVAPVELRLAISIGLSLAITLVLGAIAVALGELSQAALGWSWLALTSVIGGVSLLQETAVQTDDR